MNRFAPILAIALAGVLTVAWSPRGAVSGLVIGKAYADEGRSHESGHGKDNESKNKDNESKNKDNESKNSKDAYSTQVPVCDCSGLAASANEQATKAREEYDKAKEDEDKAKEDEDKSVICHVPPGNSGNPQTLRLPPSAVQAHLTHHQGDYLGYCVGEDSKDKQDIERTKSEADKNKTEADKAMEEADKAKSEADKNKAEMDVALSQGGTPCTCADGSSGQWIYGKPGNSAAPKSLRQIRGK